jgi:hypothetical protein
VVSSFSTERKLKISVILFIVSLMPVKRPA